MVMGGHGVVMGWSSFCVTTFRVVIQVVTELVVTLGFTRQKNMDLEL